MANYYLKTTRPVIIQKALSGIIEAVALGKIEGVGLSANFDNQIVNYSYSCLDGQKVSVLSNDSFVINGAENVQGLYNMISGVVTIDPATDYVGYLSQVHYSLFRLKMYETLKVSNPTLTLEDVEIIGE